MRAALGIALLLLAGCTLDAGRGFGTVEAATLEVGLEPGEARDLGGGAILTRGGYHVRFDALAIDVDRVALLAPSAGEAARGVFDPAAPPFGCGACHGGHCHCPDGTLPTYEELQARLSAGGGATLDEVVVMPVGRELDLLSPGEIALDAFEPSRQLPETTLAAVAVTLSSLRATARVTHPDPAVLAGEAVALELSLPVGASVDAAVARPVTRAEPARVRLAARLPVDATLFDGLDLAALATEGRVSLDDLEAPAAERVLGALLANPLQVELE